MDLRYEFIATGRTQSLFAADIEHHAAELRERISGSRIVIIGAAGSIGSSVVKTLLRFHPAALALIDLSENNLVELVRELRSGQEVLPDDFSAMPIGLGSVEFTNFMRQAPHFDYLFNLSALKHVRSEKNVFCLMRMLDTNVVFLNDFLRDCTCRFRKVFSVSSDKAANPANLMGASKMIMEKTLLAYSNEQPFSSARFANVAFSDGSLPHGFLERIAKKQPLSAPDDVRRYFISHREAGELCVLSGVLGENRDVFFPKLKARLAEKTFATIACELLQHLHYEPVICQSEDEAKARMAECMSRHQWPCYFFKSDTSGEKPFEEFFVQGERLDTTRFEQIGIIKQDAVPDRCALDEFLAFCRNAKKDPAICKNDYVCAMKKIVPTLQHEETGKNLDQKM